jgi:hypothetical protein
VPPKGVGKEKGLGSPSASNFFKIKSYEHWCCMSLIPALGRLKQEDSEFKVSLGFQTSMSYTTKLYL